MTQQNVLDEDFIIKLFNHQDLACDILPRFQEDFVGSNMNYLLAKKYISKEEYDKIFYDLDEDPDLRRIKVAELLINYKDKPDIIIGLKGGFEASLKVIKEYIRQKYPEHYRELFNSDPNECDIPQKDLKKLHRYLNKNYNAGIQIEKI